MFAMTAAHPTLPIPSYAQVTNVKNGRSVIVRINDRGPFLRGREIDLSFLAACRLGYAEQGRAEVTVRSLRPDEMVVAAAPRPATLPTPRPAESPRLPITAPNLKGKEVYLQLAAFSSRDNADQFIAHVARELDDDANRLLLQQAGSLFRVRLGPFANRDVALAYAEKLTGGKKLEAIVAR
jgi:rare lipoprotein A